MQSIRSIEQSLVANVSPPQSAHRFMPFSLEKAFREIKNWKCISTHRIDETLSNELRVRESVYQRISENSINICSNFPPPLPRKMCFVIFNWIRVKHFFFFLFSFFSSQSICCSDCDSKGMFRRRKKKGGRNPRSNICEKLLSSSSINFSIPLIFLKAISSRLFLIFFAFGDNALAAYPLWKWIFLHVAESE